MQYARPDKLADALRLLSDGGWKVLAGGTDFYPALRDRPVKVPVLDITGLQDLRDIDSQDGYWRIGALATWTDVLRADLPPAFDCLKLAAREVGSVQIQNRATVAGNICNASPAADGVPPLLALDAAVELTTASSQRVLPIAEFILGNRVTALASDELITAIRIPGKAAQGQSAFLKLGARKYLVISIAMVAARIVSDGEGIITDAAVSVGACSAVAQRLSRLERDLIGTLADPACVEVVAPHHLETLSPIDDVRATRDYRRQAGLELVRRCVRAALLEGAE